MPLDGCRCRSPSGICGPERRLEGSKVQQCRRRVVRGGGVRRSARTPPSASLHRFAGGLQRAPAARLRDEGGGLRCLLTGGGNCGEYAEGVRPRQPGVEPSGEPRDREHPPVGKHAEGVRQTRRSSPMPSARRSPTRPRARPWRSAVLRPRKRISKDPEKRAQLASMGPRF